MDSNDPQIAAELEALRARVSQLEQERRPRRFGPAVLLAAVTVATIGVTWAANGDCRAGMPWCFAANSPAMASQVNDNFTFLHDALTKKTGGLDGGGLSPTGNVNFYESQVIGTNASGNFHINTMPTTGRLYLNWHSGRGGVIFGNGQEGQAAAISAAGNLTVSTINGRSPPNYKSISCTTGNCAISCDTGTTVAWAFGFHGFDGTNRSVAMIGGTWACGQAVELMTRCAGASSCSLTTGCTTSSMVAECR